MGKERAKSAEQDKENVQGVHHRCGLVTAAPTASPLASLRSITKA